MGQSGEGQRTAKMPRGRPQAAPAGATAAQRPVVATLVGLFFLLAFLANVLIVVGTVPSLRGLWLGLLAALLPALLYGALVLSFDRYEREPWRNLLGAFAWGAVIATLFSLILGGFAGWLFAALWGAQAGGTLTALLAAPIIEESFKGLALLLLLLLYREELDGVLDGLVYGALIGLGFAMTENVLYLGQAYIIGGAAKLGELFLAREVFGGLGHALYTGTIGATVGWTRTRYGRGRLRRLVPLLGWLLAVLQHALWNGGAAVAALRRAQLPLLGLVAAQAALFVIPGLLLLGVVALRAGRAESRVIRLQLASEVATGILTAREYATLADGHLRHAALRSAFRRGGLRRWLLQQRFFQAAAELALCKHHGSQGDPVTLGDEYRVRLAALRSQLL